MSDTGGPNGIGGVGGIGELGSDRAAARTLELRRGEAAPASRAKLTELAEAFDALFTGTLLKELMKPFENGGIAGSGPGASVMQGLFETHLAEAVSKGGGLGIGKLIEEQMRPLLAAREHDAKVEKSTTKENGR